MGAFGGTSIREDILRLQNPDHVIVETPGRILDLAEKEIVDLSTVKIAVLDEVDKLLSTKFMPVTQQIFDFLSEDTQVLLFSATYIKNRL
jgi:ATP-dependent RNA helicase DDX6/DHH1